MKRNIVLKSCITSCLIASMAQNIYAEEIAVENKESTHKMSQVVVTATRTEVALEDVSASMEVITSEDIKRLGSITLKDALRKATNIDLTTGNVIIRGMNVNHAVVLLNGRKMAPESRPDSAARNALDRINVNSIERIEIVRGPSSALYGADAMGGVINIITKKSTRRSGLVGVTANNNGEYGDDYSNYYSFDTGPMGNWDALINARLVKVESEVEPDGTQNSNGLRTFFDIDLGYTINDDHEIRLNAEYFYEDLEDSYLSYEKGDPISENVSKRMSASLTYSGATEKNDFRVTPSYSKLQDNYTTTSHPFRGDKGHPKTTKKSDNNYEIYGIDMQNTYMLDEMNAITFGGEHKNTSADTSTIDNISIKYSAVYVQDEIALFDETLLITPAVRYDNYTDFGGQVSPKLGVTWKLNEDHRLKATYGLGFRAPSLNELYREGFHRADTPWYGNPDLEPEESTGWDVTYQGEYKNFFGTATYFHNDIKNLIEFYTLDKEDQREPHWRAEYTYENIAEALIKGAEAEIGVTFMEEFTLKGQYTYLDAQNSRDGERLSSRPKSTYVATLIYANPTGLSATVWSRWVRDMWNGRKNTNFNTVNASVSKTWKDKYSLFVSVDNILESDADNNDRWVDPLTWRVGFEMKF